MTRTMDPPCQFGKVPLRDCFRFVGGATYWPTRCVVICGRAGSETQIKIKASTESGGSEHGGG